MPPGYDGKGRSELRHDYMLRTTAAALGIYGNSKEEAVYPAYFGVADDW